MDSWKKLSQFSPAVTMRASSNILRHFILPNEDNQFIESHAFELPEGKALADMAEGKACKQQKVVMKEWMSQRQTLTDKLANAKLKQHKIMQHVFDIFENTLDTNLRHIWQGVVNKECHTPGWINQKGKKHDTERSLFWESLKDL